MRLLPALTGSGVSTLVIERSAAAATVVVAVAELLPSTGSPVKDAAVAVFEMTAPFVYAGSTCTVTVKTALPGTIEGSLQVTLPPAPTGGVVQPHPAGEASDTKVVPAGRRSPTFVLRASLGPLLVTVSV